jgi:hypothetical protein
MLYKEALKTDPVFGKALLNLGHAVPDGRGRMGLEV